MDESSELLYRKLNVLVAALVAGVLLLVLLGAIGFILQGGRIARLQGELAQQRQLVAELQDHRDELARRLEVLTARGGNGGGASAPPPPPAQEPAGADAEGVIAALEASQTPSEATLGQLRRLAELGQDAFTPAQALMIAQLLLRAQQPEHALAWADRVLQASAPAALDEAGAAKAHYVAGRALAALDRPAEAAQRLDQALALDGRFVDAHLGRAELAGRAQDAPAAARSLLAAAALQNEAALWRRAAQAAERADMPEQAQAAWRELHALDATDPEAALKLAQHLLRIEGPRQAIALASPAAQKHNTAPLWGLIGLAHAQLGQDDEALTAWGKALAAEPTQADLWRQSGVIHAKRRDYRAAVEAFQNCLAANPDDAVAWYYLAVMHANEDRLDDAVREATHAVTLDGQLADAHYLLAVLHARRGHAEPAHDALAAAIRLDPDVRRLARQSGDFDAFAQAQPRFRTLLEEPATGPATAPRR